MTILNPANLRVPPLPESYLPRPRLDALWPEWAGKRLILVTAGAGFGKTSFLAAGALESERPVLWYSLDPGDANLAAFLGNLSHAAAGLGPAPAAEADPRDGGFADQVLAGLLELLRDLPRGALIILDDLQCAAGRADILDFLQRLIRFLPENCTLVLSSREKLSLASMKMKMQGVANELGTAELQFEADEIEALFSRRFPGHQLSDVLARRVAERTEGWAAGVQILLQALPGPSSLLVEEALERLQAAGEGWFAFFAEEVLEGLDEDTRDFLLRASLLSCLEVELCDELLGISRSGEILDDLARRNLFTFAVAEPGAYRFHQLFRDVLRQQFLARAGEASVRELLGRAATLLRRRARWGEAAAALVGAGDTASCLDLIEEAGEDLFDMGGQESLRGALEELPVEMLAGRPRVIYALGRSLELQGRWDEAEERYRRALAAGPKAALKFQLLDQLALSAVRRGNYADGIALCDEAFATPTEIPGEMRARLLTSRAVACCEMGLLDEGQSHLQEALTLYREAGNAPGEGRSLYLLASNVYIVRGDYTSALDSARRALLIFRKGKDPRRLCHSLNTYGWVAAIAGETGLARDLAGAGLRMAESLGFRMAEGYCHWTFGRIAFLEEDPERARDHYERAREIGEELSEATLLTYPRIGLAELALEAGNRLQAGDLAGGALFHSEEAGNLLTETQCRILLGQAGEPGEAAESFHQAEEICRGLGASFELHRVLLLRWDLGDFKATEEEGLLAELLRGAARRGHEQLFLRLARRPAARLLARALQRGVEPDYASSLLIQLGERALPELGALVTDPADEVRRRAVDLLAQIGGREALALIEKVAAAGRKDSASREAAEELDLRPEHPMRVRALGSLRVSIGERELGLGNWRSKRALRLFQLLLVRRFRWVPREQIIETLWPDGDPVKGANNLRQTLFQLRRILEPERDEPRQSPYLRSRQEACRLELGEGGDYDVQRFEEALSESDRLWNGGKKKEAEAALGHALDLYGGDFLAETPYEDFAALECEQLRDRLQRALARLIEIHAAAERWDPVPELCRRGLAADPYSEDFHWHRIHAQLRLGNRKEALADFHHYETVMSRDLDLFPSDRMRSLADRIVTLGKDSP